MLAEPSFKAERYLLINIVAKPDPQACCVCHVTVLSSINFVTAFVNSNETLLSLGRLVAQPDTTGQQQMQ